MLSRTTRKCESFAESHDEIQLGKLLWRSTSLSCDLRSACFCNFSFLRILSKLCKISHVLRTCKAWTLVSAHTEIALTDRSSLTKAIIRGSTDEIYSQICVRVLSRAARLTRVAFTDGRSNATLFRNSRVLSSRMKSALWKRFRNH